MTQQQIESIFGPGIVKSIQAIDPPEKIEYGEDSDGVWLEIPTSNRIEIEFTNGVKVEISNSEWAFITRKKT